MPVIIRELSEEDRAAAHASNMHFFNGNCYSFAVALHRLTGWQIVGLVRSCEIWPDHVGVRDPDGNLRDYRGIVPYKEFGRYFGYTAPYKLRDYSPEELARSSGVRESLVELALDLIEVIWPELPMRIDGKLARAHRFTAAMEQLCRDHDIWFTTTAQGTAFWPFMSFGDDIAQGIELRPALIGNSYFFNRHLGR